MVAVSALMLCGCSSGSGNGGPTAAQVQALAIPLASGMGTAVPGALAGGTGGAVGWAIVPVGAGGNLVPPSWQLFVLSGIPLLWSEVTPGGVDDSGGLAGSFSSAGGVVGVETSGLLGFSPLASTRDDGTHWMGGILPSGLAPVPDAVAGPDGGRLLALLGDDGSSIVSSQDGGGSTTTLSVRSALAAAGGQLCDLTALTAVGFGPKGQPIAGGRCQRSSHVGVFELGAGAWKLVGPPVPVVPTGGGKQRKREAASSSSQVATTVAGPSVISEVLRVWTDGSRLDVLAEAVTEAGTASIFRLTEDASGAWVSSPVYDVAPSQRLVANGGRRQRLVLLLDVARRHAHC